VATDGRVVLDAGRERGEIRPAVVVVADGLGGSALAEREEFAWRVERRSPVGVGAVLPARPEHAADGEITMICASGGYVGAAPLGDGRWAFAAALRADDVRAAGPLGAIERALAESGIAAPALPRGSLCGAGPLTRRRARIASGRVLVVGDAAGYVQPLTGEGMSWAIVCASRIASFAERAAHGVDVSREWARECSGLLRWRGVLCRAVCSVASHPRALAAAIRLADGAPGAGWASRRLCWRSA
jgi:flavin-dependent dehydrogenase